MKLAIGWPARLSTPVSFSEPRRRVMDRTWRGEVPELRRPSPPHAATMPPHCQALRAVATTSGLPSRRVTSPGRRAASGPPRRRRVCLVAQRVLDDTNARPPHAPTVILTYGFLQHRPRVLTCLLCKPCAGSVPHLILLFLRSLFSDCT
jgi:hypothetical protein